MRYARQRAVIGELGQKRLQGGAVTILGDDLAALICARYLIGAGVATLFASASILEQCTDINPDTCTFATDSVGVLRFEDYQPQGPDPVARGADGARWALARLLRGTP